MQSPAIPASATPLGEQLLVALRPSRMLVTPGEQAIATISVRNQADELEQVRISLAGDLARWIRIYPMQLSVLPGETETARLVFDMPVFAQASIHQLAVYVVSQGATQGVASALLDIEICDDRLLRYLPAIFHDDTLLRQFLRIFESIMLPLDRQIDQLYAYFDPSLTPSDFLAWLGTWFDLVLDENWPEQRRRELLRSAARLYERRGTAWALREYLRIYVGVAPEISEGDADNPHHFTVRFVLDAAVTVDEGRIARIIEEEKPAHTTYTLLLERR